LSKVERIIQLPRKDSQSFSTTTVNRETSLSVREGGRFGSGYEALRKPQNL